MEFYDLIVRDDKTSMSLYDFLLYLGFNENKFRLSLRLWIDLTTTKRDEWFVLNDALISTLGYKRRAVLLTFIRSRFVESTDFGVINTRTVRVTRGGEHYKREIRMRKRSFLKLLVKLDTNVSRAIHDYTSDVDESVHRYDLYRKECELHENDLFLREIHNDYECILCIILCTISFVIFTVSMYLLYLL